MPHRSAESSPPIAAVPIAIAAAQMSARPAPAVAADRAKHIVVSVSGVSVAGALSSCVITIVSLFMSLYKINRKVKFEISQFSISTPDHANIKRKIS